MDTKGACDVTTNTTTQTPPCPFCRSKQTYEHGDRPTQFQCGPCGAIFDTEDDGDVTYGSPSKRMEREERRAARWAQKKAFGHRRF
jgi:hypothetical protein